jgi:hypothetical protein
MGGHQTSLTSGTLLEKTRKPLMVWFRAMFEISTRRTRISAKDLQRIMGLGSRRAGSVSQRMLGLARASSSKYPASSIATTVLGAHFQRSACGLPKRSPVR